MDHPLVLPIRVLLFETGMLIEATIDTPEELDKRWHVAHSAYRRVLHDAQFYSVPRRIKADLEFCKKILRETCKSL